ncbi:MAG: hypothetical protein ACXQS5_06780 [Candidatus Methanospirareceae archaeon]
MDFANRKHNPEPKRARKPLKWIIVDSLIIAALVFVSSLPEQLPTLADLYLAGKVAMYSFFVQLVVELGIRRAKEVK